MLSRREALRVGISGALSISAVATGIALHRREEQATGPDAAPPGTAKLPRIKDHRVERPAGALEMAIISGNDPAVNVRRAIEAMGGMGRFVRKGERVVIKPNIGWNRLPPQAANTNPAVVAEVVRHVLAAGASKVWVTDVPVNTAEVCFARSGIQEAAEKAGATIVLPGRDAFRLVDVSGRVLRQAEVLYPFVEADRVINVPIVKHHGLSGATLSMKNWYGVLGGQRMKLHQNIHLSVVDLASMVKPTLTVLDATRILMANGPTGGNLDDVKVMSQVAVGVDEVALDAYGATLLGLDASTLGFVVEGMKAGLGQMDWKSLKHVQTG